MTKSTGPACGNNPNYRMSDGDRRVVEDFKAYLADRTILRDRIAEAIRQSDFREWPLRRSVTAADAVLALLAPNPTQGLGEAHSYVGRDANGQPARADLLNTFAAWFFTTGRGSRQAADRILGKHRAEVLHEAADVVRGLLLTRTSITMAELEAVLRRMADERAATETHACDSCEGVDPDTCFNNPHRPPEQCPRSEFDGYGLQCQKPAGHNLCTFEEQPAGAGQDGAGS